MQSTIPLRSRSSTPEDPKCDNNTSSKSKSSIGVSTGSRTSTSAPVPVLKTLTPLLAAEFKIAFIKYLKAHKYFSALKTRHSKKKSVREYWVGGIRVDAKVARKKRIEFVKICGLQGFIKFEDIPEDKKKELADDFKH